MQVSRQYGLVTPSDGVRKLKDMEKKSAIWAQPMVLRLRPNVVAVEEENGVSRYGEKKGEGVGHSGPIEEENGVSRETGYELRKGKKFWNEFFFWHPS